MNELPRPESGGPPLSNRELAARLGEVADLLERKGENPYIAPRRFNPSGEAWLPVLRTTRGERRYRALFSNTAQAHRRGKARDWVVIYVDGPGGKSQWTAVTARSGRRVVRGREKEDSRPLAEPAPGGRPR